MYKHQKSESDEKLEGQCQECGYWLQIYNQNVDFCKQCCRENSYSVSSSSNKQESDNYHGSKSNDENTSNENEFEDEEDKDQDSLSNQSDSNDVNEPFQIVTSKFVD